MDISTKWNHSKKAPFSYIAVHASSDSLRIRAKYLEYSEGNALDQPGFYSVDIMTRGGMITLYLDHEHAEGLTEDLQKGMAKRQELTPQKDTPVAVCQAG